MNILSKVSTKSPRPISTKDAADAGVCVPAFLKKFRDVEFFLLGLGAPPLVGSAFSKFFSACQRRHDRGSQVSRISVT